MFVQGCFWHAHKCQKGRIPGTRSAFWEAKFEGNKRRDIRNVRALRAAGWRVLTIWECELSKPSSRERAIKLLMNKINRGA